MPARRYVVVPPMVGGLENLREMAANLWLTWNAEAAELFEHLDETLWRESQHNPLKVLVGLSSHRLSKLRDDHVYRAHAERVYRRFRAYMDRSGSFDYGLAQPIEFQTAYFSLEFGVAECLPLYSGGLGLVAGDHLKAASDLNLPMVGVGILYQEGYFRQSLSLDGRQQEEYPRTEFDTLPLERVKDQSGSPLRIFLELADEEIALGVFRANVGRLPLYLLDADLPENPGHLRRTTARLYGGDKEMRIRQEIILGIGGVRALQAMGIHPAVFHMNEGHAAFAVLERIRHFVESEGISLEEAITLVTGQSVLTLHSPGPERSELFEEALMFKYFNNLSGRLGIDIRELIGWGKRRPEDGSEPFSMPILGLRMAGRANAVSRLHSGLAKKVWGDVWPQADGEDVPIVPITHGVHLPSSVSKDLARLYDRYLGPGWIEDPYNDKMWQRTDQIPATELWRTHDRCRMRLVNFARERLAAQLKRRGAPLGEIEAAETILDPEALSICCVTRFASYQRPTLLLKDPRRLARIVGDSDRPVQFIFAGKAHPANQQGKDFIRKIWEFARSKPFRGRIVFIEDYDLEVNLHMVQGADVWLGVARRPMEPCSTSGMKAAANGALNLSVLDGWWDEGYQVENGWAIGWGEEYDSNEYQDEIERKALYDLLEESVKPVFYERSLDDLPREWIRMMKQSIKSVCPQFNSHRMVTDYIEQFYVPAARAFSQLRGTDYGPLREMVAWKKSMAQDWNNISIKSVSVLDEDNAAMGKEVEVEVTMETAGHGPGELRVELLHGPIDIWDMFKERHVTLLSPKKTGDGTHDAVVFSGHIPLMRTGLYGYEVRVTPQHPNLAFSHRFDLVHKE